MAVQIGAFELLAEEIGHVQVIELLLEVLQRQCNVQNRDVVAGGGELFGELCLFNAEGREELAIAVKKSSVVLIPRARYSN